MIEALDLGTGSGNLAVTLTSLLRTRRFKAVDQSAEALAVAYRNACRHEVAQRISWHREDFQAFSRLQDRPRFNLIVANLPYIKRTDLPGYPPSLISSLTGPSMAERTAWTVFAPCCGTYPLMRQHHVSWP